MTIYRPISTCNLDATYNVITQILTLNAEGVVGNCTQDIHIKMVAISNGLKFELGARTLVEDIETRHFQISESFKIQLLANTLLSEAITIITQNEPEGEIIPIFFVGMFQESELLPIASEAFMPKVATPIKRSPLAKPKNTRLEDSLGIKTRARKAEFAFV